MSVVVVLEQRSGKWNRASFEALAAAKAIGGDVHAVVIGSGIDALARDVAAYGVAKVVAIDNPALAEYTPDGWTAVLEQLIRAGNPQTVLFPHTYQVRDYAPKLAARLNQFLVSDVVEVKAGGPMVRQLFQGKLNADVVATAGPVFVSVQAGAFRAAEKTSANAPVEQFEPKIDPSTIRSKPEQPFREAQRSVDLGAADVIVAVGRGIKEKENLGVVQELADALGGELAASRPVCDNGWLPMERQVGSSGQTVSPKVYFAIGISGAIQHLVGMKGSKTVVAINKDDGAPIFETADYGIVGDLFEIVPALIAEVQKVKSGQ
jgi:electron transfer flavoprotein alpha subunit